uniref:Uncharacterized protein n=1 Tax=Romanomermis culicivorax TaxID=13658 RepID=A0A915LB18_ROMCU
MSNQNEENREKVSYRIPKEVNILAESISKQLGFHYAVVAWFTDFEAAISSWMMN